MDGSGWQSPDLPTVTSAYGSWSDAYIDLFGSSDRAAPEDRDLIADWSQALAGPVLDAGCGPGHWSAFLRARGVEVEGVDATPEFIAHASRVHPNIAFRLADLRELRPAEHSLGGVLAWISLIHSDPQDVPGMLRTFARALQPRGRLLVGFFSGDRLEPFDHRVVTGWRWPVREMVAAIEAAGLEIASTHERPAPNGRRNAAIVARSSA